MGKALSYLKKQWPYLLNMYGVGETTCVQLMAEIGDVCRFPKRSSIVSFAGVDPAVDESGKHISKSTPATVHFKNPVHFSSLVYADMARAFLDDKDAKPHKLARYTEYVADVGETAHAVPRSGGSEFMEIVSGKEHTAVLFVLDGHIKRMEEVNPEVYNIIMTKLKEL